MPLDATDTDTLRKNVRRELEALLAVVDELPSDALMRIWQTVNGFSTSSYAKKRRKSA